MKRCLFLYMVIFTNLSVCFAQRFPVHRDTVNVGHMHFDHSYFSFGEIAQGQRVSHNYLFKNTGKVPLVISNVLVTCGCTVPEWPKTPVAPGQTGVIKVFFNSSGKQGIQNKNITILANTKYGRETLVFNANVIVPSKQ